MTILRGGKVKGKRRKRGPVASSQVGMNAPLGDLQDQVRDRSSWRKPVWVLGVKNNLMAT